MQAYGEDIAILAGDALLSLSFEYIARETRNVAAERILRVRCTYKAYKTCASWSCPSWTLHIELLFNLA